MEASAVTAAVAHLRRRGDPITVRRVQSLTGGSFRDVAPLVKQELLNAAEVAEVEAEISEAEGTERPAPVGQLAQAHVSVTEAERALLEVQLLFQEAQSRLSALRDHPPLPTTDPSRVAETLAAQDAHQAAVLMAQREIKALEAIVANRRQERDAFRTDAEQLRQRAYDLSQAIPQLERARTDAEAELQRRKVEAAVLVRIGEDLVAERESALTRAQAELQRLRGARA